MKQTLHIIWVVTLIFSYSGSEKQKNLNEWAEDVFFFSEELKDKQVDWLFNVWYSTKFFKFSNNNEKALIQF